MTDSRREPEEEESGLLLPYHRLEAPMPSIMTTSLPPRSSATADPTYSGVWSSSSSSMTGSRGRRRPPVNHKTRRHHCCSARVYARSRAGVWRCVCAWVW